jgi:acetyl-CoA acetyltransferase
MELGGVVVNALRSAFGRGGFRFGLATMCIGTSMGIATVLAVV